MTQMKKFEDLNNRFVSLGTGMTRQHKFRDRWWTLLMKQCRSYITFIHYFVFMMCLVRNNNLG